MDRLLPARQPPSSSNDSSNALPVPLAVSSDASSVGQAKHDETFLRRAQRMLVREVVPQVAIAADYAGGAAGESSSEPNVREASSCACSG